MSNYIIDAYAWIEYFNGTKLGEKVKEIIENQSNTIFTNIITISEIASYSERNNINFEIIKNKIFLLSKIYQVDTAFAEEAGQLHAKIKTKRKHMGLADVFVLLTAKKLDGKVITGDEDFRGLKEAILIK